jgi:NADPH-dependent 2,4-dienoyl-CoA reductase/sulfur reductase-like enzyme
VNRVVIVGASAGGLVTAEALRARGYRGHITLVGAEPHLPYDRPPLSKQLLTGAWEPERLLLRSETDLAHLDLDLQLGVAATGVDTDARVVTLRTGHTLHYDALVVATGVRPRTLPGAPAHVLRTVDDAMRLRERLRRGRRLAVVGAGFLGAEVAAVARGLGCDVHLIEPAPVPLAHAVGTEVGSMLTRLHLRHGVTVRTGVGVRAVTEGGLELDNGDTLEADDVLAAVGSTPRTDWLDGSGLTVDDGLVCDAYCEAAPGVYGVGDVARWHNPLFGTRMRVEHRTHAAEQAAAVARNLTTPEQREPFAPVPYFWSDQYALKIQAFGYLRGHHEVRVVEGALDEGRFVAAYRTDDRLVGVVGAGVPAKSLRPWRAGIADGARWDQVVDAPADPGRAEVMAGGTTR